MWAHVLSIPVFSVWSKRYVCALVWIISSLTSVNTLTLELYPCHPNVPDSRSTISCIPLERLVLFLVSRWVRSLYKAPHACPWALGPGTLVSNKYVTHGEGGPSDDITQIWLKTFPFANTSTSELTPLIICDKKRLDLRNGIRVIVAFGVHWQGCGVGWCV